MSFNAVGILFIIHYCTLVFSNLRAQYVGGAIFASLILSDFASTGIPTIKKRRVSLLPLFQAEYDVA